MKRVFLILCLVFVFSAAVNAEELYKCIDSNGSAVITSTPHDGMKCVGMDDSKETPKPNSIWACYTKKAMEFIKTWTRL